MNEERIDLLRLMYFNYKTFREISLRKRKVELVGIMEKGEWTSRDIANLFGICVQNASQQLNNLFRKGYLIRDEIEDKTGGYMFVYTSNPRIFECVF